MLNVKPIKASELDAYLTESVHYERDYWHEILLSRRRAWQGCLVATGVALLALLALLLMSSKDASPPLVLRVDNSTGAVEALTFLKPVETSYGEVIDSYWLNQYVLRRESYDYNTLQLDYDATALLSQPQVQKEYFGAFDGPNALDKKYGASERVTVHVRSITVNTPDGSALVRFSTTHKRSNNQISPPQHFVATIGYTYESALMNPSDRRLNPLGFQVTSYRVDPEILKQAE